MTDRTNTNLAWAALFLRLSLGVLFLFAGLGKFVGPGLEGFAQYIQSQFAETWLPAAMTVPFAYGVPFAEIALGALLIVGILGRLVLIAAGLLLLSLAFGMLLVGEHSTVSANLIYVAMAAAGIALNEFDRFGLDGLMRR